MKYVSYAWLLIRNLIVLLIVWLLYSKTTTSFEVIILSVLLAIYAHVLYSASVIVLGVWETTIKSSKQFLHILQVLKRKDRDYQKMKELQLKAFEEGHDYFDNDELEKVYYEDETTKEGMKDQEALHKELTTKAYITGIFAFLMYAIAFLKIVMALV